MKIIMTFVFLLFVGAADAAPDENGPQQIAQETATLIKKAEQLSDIEFQNQLAQIQQRLHLLRQDVESLPETGKIATIQKNYQLQSLSILANIMKPLQLPGFSWTLRDGLEDTNPRSVQMMLQFIDWHTGLKKVEQLLAPEIDFGVGAIVTAVEIWLKRYSEKHFLALQDDEPELVTLANVEHQILLYNLESLKSSLRDTVLQENKPSFEPETQAANTPLNQGFLGCEKVYILRIVPRKNGLIDHPKELNHRPCLFINTVAAFEEQGLFLDNGTLICSHQSIDSSLNNSSCLRNVFHKEGQIDD